MFTHTLSTIFIFSRSRSLSLSLARPCTQHTFRTHTLAFAHTSGYVRSSFQLRSAQADLLYQFFFPFSVAHTHSFIHSYRSYSMKRFISFSRHFLLFCFGWLYFAFSCYELCWVCLNSPPNAFIAPCFFYNSVEISFQIKEYIRSLCASK